MKGNFSKTGLILIGSMLVCFLLVLAVGVPNGFFGDGGKSGDLDDKDTPKIEDVVKGNTPLLIFDKSEGAKALMEAFDNGQIISVNLLYDQGGGNEEVASDDPAVVRKAYRATKNITVGEKTDETVTDSYHYVFFTLEDGREIGYRFEGENVLVYPDGTSQGARYEVFGTEGLWNLYWQLAGKN